MPAKCQEIALEGASSQHTDRGIEDSAQPPRTRRQAWNSSVTHHASGGVEEAAGVTWKASQTGQLGGDGRRGGAALLRMSGGDGHWRRARGRPSCD